MTARRPAPVLAAAAAAALAFPPGAPAAPRRTGGRVEYVTARRLYLDAGTRDGLEPGAMLQLNRGDKPASTCRIETVSDSHATCVGTGRPGDTFALSLSAPLAMPDVERAAQPLSDAEVARRRRLLDAAPHEKVDYQGPPAFSVLSGKSEVRLAYATWAEQNVGPWHQERVDVAIRGMPVGGGFALYADLSARRWSQRSGTIVARPDDLTQLYVWEAELARRPAQGGLALAFGRVRPWSAPGSTIIDGGQAGWRTHGNVELGIFGGGVPDPATLAPSFERHTVGAYLAFQSTGDASSVVRYLRQETRFAYSNSPELGKRIEAEALAQVSLGRTLDLGAQARVARGDSESPDFLDGASVDLGFRPLERLSVLGGFRYQGLSVPERDGPGSALSGGAARHADLTASWEVDPRLTVSAVSGLVKDLTTGMSRRFAGPEIGLPRLLGDVGGLSLGFVAEDGWSGGHSAWVQLLTHRPRGLQVLLRVSWFQTKSLGPYIEDELGAYASISAQLGPSVALRISALGRAGGTPAPGVRPFAQNGSLLGGTLDATLAGRF
jgi:hypothetical protein